MSNLKKERFAFIKPYSDAHTLGINSIAELLKDCGYEVVVGDERIENIVNDIRYESNQQKLVDWLIENKITNIGLSYRLDEDVAVSIVGYVIKALKDHQMLSYQDGEIDTILFGGLPKSCDRIDKEHKGLVKTFKGGESVLETLNKLNVPKERIPNFLMEGSSYDDMRMEFGEALVKKGEYKFYSSIDRSDYPEFGTRKDTVVKRLEHTPREEDFAPLMRAHVGPFLSTATRMESVNEFANWTKALADAKFLDIVSIGTSCVLQ